VSECEEEEKTPKKASNWFNTPCPTISPGKNGENGAPKKKT
jgi:hypothetical protein